MTLRQLSEIEKELREMHVPMRPFDEILQMGSDIWFIVNEGLNPPKTIYIYHLIGGTLERLAE